MKKDYSKPLFIFLLIVSIMIWGGEILCEEQPEDTLEEGDVVIRDSPNGRMDDWWGILFTKNAGYVGIYVEGFEGLKL